MVKRLLAWLMAFTFLCVGCQYGMTFTNFTVEKYPWVAVFPVLASVAYLVWKAANKRREL